MSILSPNDPARNLDIFKYYPDFDHTQIDIWTRDIPDYQIIKSLVCIVDIETTPIKRNAKGEIDFQHPDNRILAIRTRLNGVDRVFELENENLNIDESADECEYLLIRNFIDYINDEDTNIYVLTGHHIFNFDLPYIISRANFHGIGTGFKFQLEFNGLKTIVKNSCQFGKPIQFLNIVHQKFNIVDTLHLCAIADKREAKLSSWNLKYVCGPEGYNLRKNPERVELPGDQIYNIYFSNRQLFHLYLLDDINDTELLIHFHLPSIYYLLKYIPNINLQNLVFSGNAQKWQLMIKPHYQSFPEADPKTSYLGAVTAIKSGVFKNCAKFDIRSLYPSIMVHQRVHSRKDPDQYQLKVLSVLKAKRLELKDQKSNLNAQFESLALKILINSGYGFLGTEFIRYNDMQAAAKVTAYGRAILDFMISFVQNKGANVIQADTDGIVLNYANGDIDTLHKELQNALPAWVEVELESKYDLVWLYKRKNYITYKGDKISSVGLVKKRNKSQLYKRFLKYLPQLYNKKGMCTCKMFVINVLYELEQRKINSELLAQTEKIVEHRKNPDTKNQKATDLNATPGESVTFYLHDKLIKYETPKKKITKEKIIQSYKRLSEFNNDYSIDYYNKEIYNWFEMFYNSIMNPISETSTGELLDNED